MYHNVKNSPPKLFFRYTTVFNKIRIFIGKDKKTNIFFIEYRKTSQTCIEKNIMKSKKNGYVKTLAVSVESMFTQQSENCIYNLIFVYSWFSRCTQMPLLTNIRCVRINCATECGNIRPRRVCCEEMDGWDKTYANKFSYVGICVWFTLKS